MRQIKQVLFNEERANKVFKIISNLWLKKLDVLADLTDSHSNLPKIKNRIQKANFLFVLVMAERGPIFSEKVAGWFAQLWERNSDLFDPLKLKKVSKEQIITDFIATGIIKNDQRRFLLTPFFDDWKHNFTIIAESFNGNILNIFKGSEDLDLSQIVKRMRLGEGKIDSFRGIQVKLLTYFVSLLQKNKLIKYFPIPFPVDFHRLRLLWSTDVINLAEFEKPFLDLPGASQVNIWG